MLSKVSSIMLQEMCVCVFLLAVSTGSIFKGLAVCCIVIYGWLSILTTIDMLMLMKVLAQGSFWNSWAGWGRWWAWQASGPNPLLQE